LINEGSPMRIKGRWPGFAPRT